jgi:transmembrane sensor
MTGAALNKDGQESALTVDAAAAQWAARLDAAPDVRDPDLETWLQANPRHAGALLRAQALLYTASQRAQLPPLEAEPVAPRRGWIKAGAGGLAACALVALAWLGLGAQDYRTDMGEIRQLALADGSAVTIDGQSRLSVDLDRDLRQIRLKQGRALFRVAHNAARPFRVSVGAITVTDVGTVFTVSQNGADVTVLVREGEVEVAGATGVIRLKAGQRATFAAGRPAVAQNLPPDAMDRAMAWSDGRFELDGDSLASALAEINRHNLRQIRLARPELGREKLYGAFRLDDPEGFARAAALGMGAPMRSEGDAIIIGAK